MSGSLTLIGLGVLLGIRHAVDPDHVVAIGTIAARTRSFRRSAALGALWGLGHMVTILLVGGTIVVMRMMLSVRVALALEFGVALMLIVLGLMNLYNARESDGSRASHAWPLVVGMVHGLAGSAAIALLVLATISDATVGLLYLICFGAGTIAGMVGVTGLLVWPLTLAVSRVGISHRWLGAAAGIASVAFGISLVHALGGPAALFAGAPAFIAR